MNSRTIKSSKMHWQSFFVEIFLMASICEALECGNHILDCEKSLSKKYSFDELLSVKFPYTDPRTDHQLDMDPCKSGKIAFS